MNAEIQQKTPVLTDRQYEQAVNDWAAEKFAKVVKIEYQADARRCVLRSRCYGLSDIDSLKEVVKGRWSCGVVAVHGEEVLLTMYTKI